MRGESLRFRSKYASLSVCVNPRAWPKETYHKFSEPPACSFARPSLRSRRFDSHPSVRLARLQVADAQLRQIARVALINLFHGKVRVVHFVLSRGHIFGIIGRGGDHRTSLLNAHAEFPGGRLIIRIAETMADAAALDGMTNK